MSGTVLTNKGLALITKLVAASTELQISRVAVGTGRVPSGVDPQTMVDLNEYKMDAQIESYGVSPDQSDVAYIAAQVSSIGVSAGFAVTEAGVFATDPDVGEILYAYLDLTEDPQYIYAETDAISKFAEITFNVLIGSVTKVTAYVSPGALTKKVDFNAFKESVETPEFDDSGTVEGISSFPSFLETMKSKMNFFQFFRNLKAGLQFVLHAGQIVNNCVTDNAGLPLSAAQGKILKDLYTQLYSDMGKKISIGGEMIGGYVNWQKSDGRFATIIIDTPDGPNQLILEKNSAAVTILRNNTWQEQYRLATISMLSDYVLKSDLVVSSAALQSKQNVTDESYIKFYKYGKIVVAHITVTTTSEVSGYNVLKLGVIPNGFRPNFECRSLILRQQSNESRILAFTTSGDINLWNWSTNAGITTPSGSSFCGEAVFCVA